ncbi:MULTISPECIES: DUF3892 domain-containing protein [unclassified Pseudomonas]|uniref:DUF3892 domain-containing protein n=1 Tax=unclassified Pseudomonas TaxID=196821 RepID=UPI00131C7D74|nr:MULTISPECIES: DUF3892 domain-containing protein [unclassified Pseudomonas]
MAKNIRGNRDGENGENQSYTIPGRGVVSREQLVKEVDAGKHPGFNTVNVDGVEYVRSNPDNQKGNNVNKD